MQCNAIFKEVVKQTATVEKLKSGLPKYDKEIQECEDNITDIGTVESELNLLIDQAESLKNEQQQIMTELQQKKKTVKDKQSTVRRIQHDVQEATHDKTALEEKIEEIKTSV
ncbi:hypothetical protein OS493_000101 [Desmophyllum pertusum]|uniref:Uncharacterized protein n=1 Tax=Desmophyllum pertusum TaxID=174260 RepID=A0A9X0AA19_9CNID|nr:hypothetical protein OS493_000101 [Desmophyllum pertusum]